MKGKITNWNAARISFAGRVTLSQSVLSSMPIYAMQTSKFPIGTCDDLEKAIRGFLWGSTEEQRRMSMVSWDSVARSKEEGGLGLRDFHTVNNAFGVKLCWEIFVNSNSLWAKILCAKYKFDPSIEFAPVALNVCSPLWRLVCQNWKDMWSNVFWSVGAGTNVRFWLHNWVPSLEMPLAELAIGVIPEYLMYKPVNHFVSDSASWKWELFEQYLPQNALILIAAILPPSGQDGADEAFWGLSASGNFTLKSAYMFLVNSTDSNRLPWHVIWRWYGPQRVKTFMWLLLNNGVMTNMERVRRHVASNTACGLCGSDAESSLHLLRDCPDATLTWKGLLATGNFDSFFDSMLSLEMWVFTNLKSREILANGVRWSTLFGCCIWQLWKKRNAFVFKGERISSFGVREKALAMAMHTAAAASGLAAGTADGNRVGRIPREVKWLAPPDGFMKLNSDASLLQNTNQAFGGGVIRDHLGAWQSGFVVNIGVCSILKAEVWCIYYGIMHALSKGIGVLHIESDNYVAVEMIKGHNEVNVHCRSLINSIRALLNRFEVAEVFHVHREGNFVADFLSHYAYSYPRGVHAIDQPPEAVKTWLFHDVIGVSYER